MSLLGVLLIGPLLYTQVLPLTRPPDPIPFFRPIGDPPPQPPQPKMNRSGSTRTLSQARTWTQPLYVSHVPTGPIETDIPLAGAIGPDLPSLVTSGNPSGVGIGLHIPGVPDGPPIAPPAQSSVVTTPAVTPPAETRPVRVGGDVQASKLIRRVLPAYPSTARIVRASGTVQLVAIIGKDGRVKEVRLLSGHPLLKNAAVAAVEQWIYSPTILNGVPVEVEAPIDVNFSLQ